jgi:hypothetical protein
VPVDALVVPTLVGLLILALPAGILVVLRGARVLTLGLTAPVSVAAIGLLGVFYDLAGLSFSPLTVAVPTVVSVVAGTVLARRARHAERAPQPAVGLLVAAAAAAVATVGVLLSGIGAADAISVSYDAVFHLSAAASVLDTGSASSFTLYEVSNPGAASSDFYPAAWHAVVALIAGASGASIAVATNAATLAVAMAAWIPGIVFLTDAVFPVVARRTALLCAAAVLASCFAAFPYLLIDWGTLYPSYLAYALLPAGLGLLVLFLRGVRRPLVGWLGAVWLLAEVFAHPRSLPTFAVLATPLLVSALIGWLVRMHRDPARRRRARWFAAGAVAAVAVALPLAIGVIFSLFDTPGRPVSDRLNGGPARANQDVAAAILQAVGLGPVVSPTEVAVAPSLLLAAVVLTGVVLCLRHPPSVWLVVAWGALIVLYTLAASSDSDAAKILTGLWYKDKYRLVAAIPVVATPLAAYGVAAAIDAVGKMRWASARRWALPVIGTTLVGSVAVSCWFGPSLAGVTDATRTVFAPSPRADTGIDDDALALLDRVDEYVPEGALVLGNPWNGAALTWALGGREPVFPHLTGDWDEPRLVLAERLDAAATDAAVCAAAAELDATHVFAAAGLLGGGDDAAPLYAGIDRAVGTPDLLTEVAREGDAALYELTACR